ncbi:inorganic diphosphatase [Mesonia aquimarina]|uniref:inorganic diphosphatase n=1 Tax=Mesonia aquimarina TaxID=1504967 RepID=UPI001F09F2F6|nr:inorganic diphosphatase [Mesonia aquimarina]
MKNLIFIGIAMLFFSCAEKAKTEETNTIEKTDFYKLPSFSKDSVLQAVIEIPAGTNHKIEYNPIKKKFITDSINGKARVIDFLPYLGNYGFIPSTFSDPKKGGDGDALDILVLSESVPTGTVMQVTPIALIRLIDEGESDYKILAVPTNSAQQIIQAKNFNELSVNYPEIRKVIGIWFQEYDPNDKVIIKNWGGEHAAKKEIKRWQK